MGQLIDLKLFKERKATLNSEYTCLVITVSYGHRQEVFYIKAYDGLVDNLILEGTECISHNGVKMNSDLRFLGKVPDNSYSDYLANNKAQLMDAIHDATYKALVKNTFIDKNGAVQIKI